MIVDFTDILAKPGRQRDIVSEELAEIVEKYGDDRRTHDPAVRRGHVDGGPHPRGGRRRHDHPRRLRQAHPGRRLPLAAARRQGRARRVAARRGHGRPLLHDHLAPLAALLHQPRPGLPRQGLRAAGCRPRRQGPARRQRDGLPAGRADRPGARRCATTQSAPTSCSPRRPAWSRRPASASTTARAAVASSPSTCATATSSSGPAWPSRRDDLLLVSRKGQSVRFHADDATLRPMGRATSGVTGHEVPRRRLAAGDVGRARGHRPRRVRRLRDGHGQALEGRRTGTSRAAPSSASPSPSCPTRAATSSGP